jgi:hypothetical protein
VQNSNELKIMRISQKILILYCYKTFKHKEIGDAQNRENL